MIAGCAGGVLNAIVGHPFDTIKVRQQTGNGSAATESNFGLFDGLLSQLVGVTPFWMVFYFGYKFGRLLQPNDGLLSLARAGAIAGALSSVVYCPVQAVKCVAQSESITSAAALQKLTSHGTNPLGIFRGLLPTLGYAVPAQSAFYLTYEVLLRCLPSRYFPSGMFQQLVAGGLAGIAEFSIGMPMDTIKTRCQTSNAKFWRVAVELWQKEGFLGYYRGYKWAVLRAFPANGSAMVGISLVNSLFVHIGDRSLAA
eukprot:SAG31_NODE_558_length_14153_cov_9.068094_9_plen_255_part_00